MNSDHLIHMANQIGTFFESMPERKEGVEGVATHLKKFWDPRMRRDFLALVDGNAGGRIKDIVLEATRQHRAMLG